MADDPLAALRGRFRDRGAETAARIRVHLAGPEDPELERLVHSLAGAAAMFGHAELGEAALAIDAIYAADGLPTPEALASLADALERL